MPAILAKLSARTFATINISGYASSTQSATSFFKDLQAKPNHFDSMPAPNLKQLKFIPTIEQKNRAITRQTHQFRPQPVRLELDNLSLCRLSLADYYYLA